jgi:hypothetical protein
LHLIELPSGDLSPVQEDFHTMRQANSSAFGRAMQLTTFFVVAVTEADLDVDMEGLQMNWCH